MSTSEICMDKLKNPLTVRYKAQSCVSAYLMGKANCGRWQCDKVDGGEEGPIVVQAEAQTECNHRNASV